MSLVNSCHVVCLAVILRREFCGERWQSFEMECFRMNLDRKKELLVGSLDLNTVWQSAWKGGKREDFSQDTRNAVVEKHLDILREDF